MRRLLLSLAITLLPPLGLSAQNDPVLAGLIAEYTSTAQKELKQQEEMMLLESTGHIWTREEVEATTDLQKEFNGYLDSFRSVIVYAAQVYGFYYEIDRLVDNLGEFSDVLSENPYNALAVALSAKRNSIYQEVIIGGVDIVNDIRIVCLSDNKMTERERVEMVFGIRPKLKLLNRKILQLTRAVKYTTMYDIWLEIDEGSMPQTADKASVARAAHLRWRNFGRTVRP